MRARRVAIVVVCALLMSWAGYTAWGNTFAWANDNNFGYTTQLTPGRTFDVAVILNHPRRDVTLQDVGFPPAQLRHLRLTHVALTQATVRGQTFMGMGLDWPPKSGGAMSFPIVPLAGQRLSAGPDARNAAFGAYPVPYAVLILAFMADAPGVYAVGPVTLKGEAVVFEGVPFITTPVVQMIGTRIVVCIQAADEECQAAQQRQ